MTISHLTSLPPTPPLFMDTLPEYTPSAAAPEYHPEAFPDELTLDFQAGRSTRRVISDGTFIKSKKGITLVLTEQDCDASAPTYARHGTVRGNVLLEDEHIHSVIVKLDGRQIVSTSDVGTAINTQLFSEGVTLWSRTDHPPCAVCPSILPFELQFPYTYIDGKETRPLPPSFNADSSTIPGFSIRCHYTLTVTVTKTRFAGFKRTKNIIVPVNYHPRSRPFLPIGCGLQPFLETVKCAPGDWRQVSSTVLPREGATIGPIEAHLFIPSVQIYAISDTIPFHLQLQGSAASLHAFLFNHPVSQSRTSKALRRVKTLSMSHKAEETISSSVPVPLPSLARASSNPLLPEPPPCITKPDPSLPWYSDTSRGKPVVRVFLLRQILIKFNGLKSWRNMVLGEGKLRPVQVQYDASLGADAYDHMALDWEGELRCNADVTVGGFNNGSLVIKDFVMVELKPASPDTSPLLEHQHPHPIRLVTDPYADS